MAVDAIELRPRNAVALFDAAVRVCATNSGVWALTLPSGGLVVAAVFWLAETVRMGRNLLGPSLLLTVAWAIRAISQGAACHSLDQHIVGSTPPTPWASVKAALRRAPSLVVTSAVVALLNLVLTVFTAGFGLLFMGAHAAAYAATMRGQGSALNVYGTASRLLGPARHVAPLVRLCGASQLLLAFNLFVSTALTLSVIHGVFGFDVTFLERFTSIDNPTWVLTVAALTFALFEPVRAAVGALLLIDGRVRQEGLDLIAQLEQLPTRTRKRSTLLTGVTLALLAWPALAQPALQARARRVAADCEMEIDLSVLSRRPATNDEQSALARLLTRIEQHAYQDEDCERAEADLAGALEVYEEPEAAPAPVDARARAQKILARPEFESATPHVEGEEPEAEEESPGWLARLLRRFFEWLFNRDPPDLPEPSNRERKDTDLSGAAVVMVIAAAVVLTVLVVIVLRALNARKRSTDSLDESGGLTQSPLAHDEMSALSRPAETWAGLADELAARGEFREAIRHLYLALLSRLHRDGAIDYDPTLSNWEYLFAFRGAQALKTGFRELTRRFDFAWYGHEASDALAYGTFRRLAEPLLTPRPMMEPDSNDEAAHA